jgi:hypothetical protein
MMRYIVLFPHDRYRNQRMTLSRWQAVPVGKAKLRCTSRWRRTMPWKVLGQLKLRKVYLSFVVSALMWVLELRLVH